MPRHRLPPTAGCAGRSMGVSSRRGAAPACALSTAVPRPNPFETNLVRDAAGPCASFSRKSPMWRARPCTASWKRTARAERRCYREANGKAHGGRQDSTGDHRIRRVGMASVVSSRLHSRGDFTSMSRPFLRPSGVRAWCQARARLHLALPVQILKDRSRSSSASAGPRPASPGFPQAAHRLAGTTSSGQRLMIR